MPVARADVLERVDEDAYRAVAVRLDSHHSAVSRILEAVFASSDFIRVVSERHDKYKPATMRLEEDKGVLKVGFRGHPYMLSFKDFEDAFTSPREVAVATCIGRLHHFINMRNVDTFVHTMALAKSYLDGKGVSVGLSELKKEVLKGLIMLHVTDMVSGFVEQALLSRSAEPVVFDTESLEDVEPHIPLSISIDLKSKPIKAVAVLHGLTEVVKPILVSRPETTISLEYTVCNGVLKQGGRVFEESSCRQLPVSLVIVHKQVLIKRLLALLEVT